MGRKKMAKQDKVFMYWQETDVPTDDATATDGFWVVRESIAACLLESGGTVEIFEAIPVFAGEYRMEPSLVKEEKPSGTD